MDTKKGFTLIELLVVGTFAALLVIIFFVQKASVDAMNRDNKRTAAINAMYYALEEWYYPTYGYYPSEISDKNLTVIDPALFTDPFGTNIGNGDSTYSYEPANCNENNECREYILRAEREKEDTYIKRSRNR